MRREDAHSHGPVKEGALQALFPARVARLTGLTDGSPNGSGSQLGELEGLDRALLPRKGSVFQNSRALGQSLSDPLLRAASQDAALAGALARCTVAPAAASWDSPK